jgi:CBS domain containing-hemolysin-like protein
MQDTIWLDLLKLTALVVLVVANAFFVAAEFALVSVRRTRIDELVTQGNEAAKWVQKATKDPDRFIAATQLGITLASLGLGWLGEPALAHLLEPIVALVPGPLRSGVSHGLAAAIAFGSITFLHVVVGELAPKSIALQSPERTSLIVARPTVWTERVFKPVIWILNGAGNGLLRLIGVRPATGREMVHSVEELKMLVSASAEGGVVEAEEQDMLHAVLDLSETPVRQVMVPRTEMVAIPASATLDEMIAITLEYSYTRFPVYEANLDEVLGVVHLRDIVHARNAPSGDTITARQLMREAIFVPETVGLTTVLRHFRSRRQHLAIVLDEYGGTAGVVTLSDLLEEIIGEVSDEFDTGPTIEPLPDGSALVDGLASIDEVNEFFHLNLSDPYYDSIAGFVLGRLGRLPQLGDTVIANGIRLRVEALDGRRIARISLSPASPQAEPPPPPAPAD